MPKVVLSPRPLPLGHCPSALSPQPSPLSPLPLTRLGERPPGSTLASRACLASDDWGNYGRRVTRQVDTNARGQGPRPEGPPWVCSGIFSIEPVVLSGKGR